jgi:hypothetical protein
MTSKGRIDDAMKELYLALAKGAPKGDEADDYTAHYAGRMWVAFGDLQRTLEALDLYTPLYDGPAGPAAISEIFGGPQDGALLIQPVEPPEHEA